MKMTKLIVTAAIVSLTTVSATNAALTVNAVDIPVQATTGISGNTTTGANMVGMTVTATFADSSSETIMWGATGADSGAAAGMGWSLAVVGDTLSAAHNWTLTSARNSALVNLFIDGGPGNTVFDRTLPDAGTPNSGSGVDFEPASDFGLNITATYMGAVAVTPNVPVGDLYRFLFIDFGTGLQTATAPFTFRADTDTLSGDVNTIPEPGTMAIWSALGLCGVVGRRRFSRVSNA